MSGNTSRLFAAAALSAAALDLYEPDSATLLALLRNHSASTPVLDPVPFRRLNLTMRRSAEYPPTTRCDKYTYTPFVYLALAPVWWALGALWALKTYTQWSAQYRPIHSLLCAVPAIQLVHSILSICAFSACPWEGTRSMVFAVAWAMLTGLKGPIMLQALLLVAKGWCITRDELSRREGCLMALNLAFLWMAVSVHNSTQTHSPSA